MFDQFILKTENRNLPAQDIVDEDSRLLGEVHETGPLPVVRLWTNRSSIVVPARDNRLPGFDRAREILAQRNIQLATRTSGGTAVLHGPGVLNASVIFRVAKTEKVSMEAGYAKLMSLFDLLVPELAGQACFASVPGAYCDGDYNLVVDGRKIAGTAQRIKSAGMKVEHRTILAHMSLLVDIDALEMERTINLYYEALQSDTRVREGVSTGISNLCPVKLTCDSLIGRFVEKHDAGGKPAF
ncbi:lipoate--protein ligase family protein [Emcibacter sp.]|uniref:lipoate--protein ligase family protein n=1 Tax=Emcibacter sp. TaxID=1979954 RepID=UPI003A8E4D4B